MRSNRVARTSCAFQVFVKTNETVTQCSFLRAVLTLARCIDQFTRVCSESLRKRKNNQFCVQEFCADREFHELTRQGGKLDVL